MHAGSRKKKRKIPIRRGRRAGAAIAYVAEGEAGHRAIYIMAADGSDPHRLAFSKKQDFCFPAWSQDGKFLAFTVLNRLGAQAIVTGEEKPRCEIWTGEYQIFTFNSDGKTHQIRSQIDGHEAFLRRVVSPK